MASFSSKSLVRITASPVQTNCKLVNISRPNTFDGVYNDDGTLKYPGTIHLLKRLILDDFDNCLLNGNISNFKKTIIFVKNVKKMVSL